MKDSDLLIHKLDEFIRKYYKNQMIRGSIYAVALILASYLVVALLEYFGRFNIPVRTFLFWVFVLSSGYVIVRFFMIPLFRMFRLGKVISYEEAALIVGTHFPDVQDKLLNTLQLQKQHEIGAGGDLISASIQQRIQSLRPVPFTAAIDLRENRKYLRYALPPLAIIVILLFSNASILTKPTSRLIRHGQIIADEAPFTIRVLNSLEVAENSDLEVQIVLEGTEIPDRVYLEMQDQQFLLEQVSPLEYRYVIRNIREDLQFSFYASGYHSDSYDVHVLPAPGLIDFSVALDYPAYTNQPDESLRNTGDITVPAGTRINWEFLTRNTDQLFVRYADSLHAIDPEGNRFHFDQTAVTNVSYCVRADNRYFQGVDSVVYRIQVIPDLAPRIAVEEDIDSTSLKLLYFTGQVDDDYGFRRLTFNYRIQSEEAPGEESLLQTIEIPVTKEFPADEFFFTWDLLPLNVAPGDKFYYYFEVWDNDGFLGSKSTRTPVREYALPTEEELEEQIEQQNEEIKDQLEESIRDSKKLQKEIEELQRQMLEKQQLSWQDQKRLEELMKQQQELAKQVQDIQQKNQQKNQQQNEFSEQEQRILEKQEQLEQLMNEVMSPELQKMMEEIQRMMEELNKDQMQEQLQQMDFNNEDLEKELERALEQFKQLEVEQKMTEAIEKLEELGERQEELSKESEQKESSPEELQKKQEELNKEFEQVREDIDELNKLNEELENPQRIPDTEQQEQDIQQDQQKSSDELQKNKKSNASKSQKSAGQKMKQMAETMQMAMDSGAQEQQQEDMEALRALLENIITLSFDEERVMEGFRVTDPKDPNYNTLGQQQRKLKDESRMVEDSLFALSKRVPQISAAVNREINQVNENMDRALEAIPDRRTSEVTTSQQYVMTSFNNLALMLDEALKQMQQQASCSKPGTGNCEKPGGMGQKPKPSVGQMKQMQESLSKQLEELRKQGKNKGENKGSSGQMSKQLAEIAAQQAAIRKLMEEKAAELNEDGSGAGNELKEISREMEQLQKDIVNNNITEETLRRQQDIMIRLLKAENAERVREQDNQRKSNESQGAPVSNPMKYAEYMRRKEREIELLRTVPPELRPYYREKVNSYFNRLGGQ